MRVEENDETIGVVGKVIAEEVITDERRIEDIEEKNAVARMESV